jgi:hypothetical protein
VEAALIFSSISGSSLVFDVGVDYDGENTDEAASLRLCPESIDFFGIVETASTIFRFRM